MNFFTEEKNFVRLRQLTEQNKYSKIFILTDQNTSKHCLRVLEPFLSSFTTHRITIPAGEENKNLKSCELIWDALTQNVADRHSLLINLGGGMVTDIGGFAASVYKRGIPFINLPTTLLGMVDAAIGGKTGVDFQYYKNQIGTFCKPEATYIYTGFLNTLDGRNKISGIAEMIKHTLIADPDQWQEFQNADENYFYSKESIAISAGIKIKIVEDDPLEKGKRKLLNFGHTVGHAMESFSLDHDSEQLLHGEAVAMGMLCESWISNKITGLSEADLDQIKTVILKHFKKYPIEKSSIDELIKVMLQDKKNKDNQINFSLLKVPGQSVFDIHVEEKIIVQALDWYRTL